MNLAIDIGNTLVKTAIFKDNELLSFSSFEDLSVSVLKSLLEKNPSVENVILSSVIIRDNSISDFLRNGYHYVELTSETRIPIVNLYQSPHTLGNDRIACAVGANSIFPGCDVLAVDAGTCIKYDFVNSRNQYLGGGISPGIEMRFRALNNFTGKLPLVSYRYFDKLIGENTDESILSGVMNGVAEELRGIVHRYAEQYPDVRVVFTGGYLKFFERIFNISHTEKSSIFADPFLVLKGLNQILNFNERK